MAISGYTIRALDESTWDAFAALVDANGGIFGGCWCALVFDGDDCLGWAQFGSPDELPRIKSRAAYEKSREGELPAWRIGCCYVGKGHRRKGVAAAALAGALDLIASCGGGTVEGYPEPAGAVPAGFLYNGALSTYESLGFERARQIGKHRWVVVKNVLR